MDQSLDSYLAPLLLITISSPPTLLWLWPDFRPQIALTLLPIILSLISCNYRAQTLRQLHKYRF